MGVRYLDAEAEALQRLRRPIYATQTQTPASAAARPSTRPAAAAQTSAPQQPASLPPVQLPPMPDDREQAMRQVIELVAQCERCPLHATRKNTVPGAGSLEAELVFVGEAPGRDEDIQGVPFVGAAGDLLTKMIAAMGYTREQVFICNICKCRPPGNRDPQPDEIEQCEPYLKRQLQILKPKVIVALGRCAAQTLLQSRTPISRLRGKWHEYEGVPFMPTFHPAYLLRDATQKRLCWEDLKEVMRKLGKPVP
ncbi:uracil-DNA glycosylase [Candidatus Sumerlaeota bacterium]|nr:uracil-DNA glycosylase [Candidatus Sumerlaeota bacterium]